MMRLLPGIFFIVALLFSLSACETPADPVAYGTLCLPASEPCPDQVDLIRNAVGGNAIDLEIRNQGEPADIFLRVTTTEDIPSAFGVLVRDEEGRRVLVARDYGLAAGEAIIEQLGTYLLTTANSLTLDIECLGAACAVELDYVLVAQPLECVENGDCNRLQTCEIATGRCVECLATSDCGMGQTCDREKGVCTPPTPTGCATHQSSSPPWSMLVFGLVIIALLLFGFRVLRPLRTLLCALLLAGLVPTRAEAAPPRASFAVGGGPRMLTGELGNTTGIGYGFIFSQELRGRYLGGALALSTSTFPTSQSGPPIAQNLQSYSVTLGPRAYISYARFEFFGAPEYLRWGLTSNPLVRQTGLDLMFNGAGGVLGARYRWMGLEARLETSYYKIIELPGSMATMNLMIGIAP